MRAPRERATIKEIGGVNVSVKALKINGDREFQQAPVLDAEWYLAKYPDVAFTGLAPDLHYHLYGHRLGRDPSPDFSTVFFRELLGLKPDKDPLRALLSLAEQGEVPKDALDSNRILWAAASLSQKNRAEQALILAERWLPKARHYQGNVVRANIAARKGDDHQWLEATNAYLGQFGVSKIHLEGSGSLFDRIQAKTNFVEEEGPRVSIIMAAWNSEHTVGKALNSLLAQSWRNIEVLVMDDCSTDGTWGVVSEIASKDCRVRAWRNSENVGPYVSKSIAASYASGDWITCHDADDWAHPERIFRQLKFCLDNGRRACMSGMLRISETGEYTKINRPSDNVYDGACRNAFISLFVSAHLFHDLLGAWDQMRTSGDSELLRRLEVVTGKKVKWEAVPTMFCRDHEGGLTNHMQYGLTAGSSSRAEYKRSYMNAHKALNRYNSRYVVPALKRPFHAPLDLQVPADAALRVAKPHMAQLRQTIKADVVVITNANFPGGNASSTLDELNYFKKHGLKVALVHCPVDSNLGREVSARYEEQRDIMFRWSRVVGIDAKVLICRHPRVLTSSAFAQIAPGIRAEYMYVVKNNSAYRTDGSLVYHMNEMLSAARSVSAQSLEFCPISQAMRMELLEHSHRVREDIPISGIDWTPTFDPDLYFHPAKRQMAEPYRIGRHARDGAEKWREDPLELLQAYPNTRDFEIRILGGAEQAGRILGNLPDNWRVYAFGEIEPSEYLESLDAFVYFPNSGLVEGFGRTIVEAMIAGVPVIVPPSLSETFGDLAFCCEPKNVARIVRLLAEDVQGRVGYLAEVQCLALRRYGTDVIAGRLGNSGLDLPVKFENKGANCLSEEAHSYRARILESA